MGCKSGNIYNDMADKQFNILSSPQGELFLCLNIKNPASSFGRVTDNIR